VLQPIKSASLSADWYKITRRDYILGGAVFSVIRGPVQSAFPTLPGPIIGIIGPYENLGKDVTSGLEFDAQARHDFSWIGTISFHGTWTHLIYYELCGLFAAAPGQCLNVAGTHGPSGISGNTGTPRDRAQAIVALDRGPYEAGFTLNYVSGYSLADPTTFNDGLGQPGGCRSAWYASCRVASFTDVDLFGHYDLTRKLQINAHILNVLDKDAPFDPEANYGVKNYSSNWAQQGAGRALLPGGHEVPVLIGPRANFHAPESATSKSMSRFAYNVRASRWRFSQTPAPAGGGSPARRQRRSRSVLPR